MTTYCFLSEFKTENSQVKINAFLAVQLAAVSSQEFNSPKSFKLPKWSFSHTVF